MCLNSELLFIIEIRDNISYIINLQTLLLNGCSSLKELLKDLRHLSGIRKMTNLQTLTQFVLDKRFGMVEALSNRS